MKFACCILLLLCMIILTKYFLYRRQILDICRQLEFLKNHETNKRMRTTLTTPEILALTRHLDEIYDGQDAFRNNLKAKDRRMKEMLVNVSHDIRTPLTSLKGYFQLLLSEEDTCKRDSYASIMQEKLDELTVLLDELFTYTKLQNEEYHLEMTQENFTELVLQALFSFHEGFKKQGITPQMDMEETPCFVVCNPSAVKRVLSNIIRNAMLHGDGQIAIRYYTEGEYVCLTCANTLLSPDSIDMAQVFERFYKADAARSRHSTGLGLSIAKGFVEKMGGQIEAELDGDWFLVQVKMQLAAKKVDTSNTQCYTVYKG